MTIAEPRDIAAWANNMLCISGTGTTTTYAYDNPSQNGKGLLSRVSVARRGVLESAQTFVYDLLGSPIGMINEIDGVSYVFRTEINAANLPTEITLTDLAPDTQYFYSINGVENTFHTARAPGSTFTFTIQADSHLDSNTSPEVYEQTLANQRADQPDFMIDLGDTFMTEKYKPFTAAESQYLAQRFFMSQLADTASLFLVLGNHDGEGAPRGNAGTEISAWAAGTRTKYFPNAVPDNFYAGNTTAQQTAGLLQDYYAWTWGNAPR